MVKSFFKELMNILESIGRARAASVLAQQGHHKEARALMVGK